MGFLTPTLLAGTGLIALPVILHLVMRRQPQKMQFPALRFVQQRRDANRRRVKLRHWLLLAMRCLLICGLALALARPTLQGSGLRGKEGAPLAIAIVLDNSVRMEYVRQNATRLEHAVRIAGELLEQIPEETEVSVIDLSRFAAGFAADRSTALSRLKNVRSAANTRPLADSVVEAIQLAAGKPDHRQEVFVFSDMAKSAWDDDATASVAAALEEAQDVKLYLVDVGVKSPTNSSLGNLRLGQSVLRPGETLAIAVEVDSADGADAALVELAMDRGDGGQATRDRRLAEPADGVPTEVVFEVADLPLGVHQGQLHLRGADPLSMDNTRFFTVEVRPPARVLLLAESDSAALFIREALEPSLFEQPIRFTCETRLFEDLGGIDLSSHEAVLLLDPPPLETPWWDALLKFTEAGGGVGLMLGHNAEPGAMNSPAAQRLLPGPLKQQARDETYLRPKRLDHPALAALSDFAESIPWPQCKVFTYWDFTKLHDDASVAAHFANGEPALVARQAGRGRLLTFATPISDPLEVEGRDPWNVLPAPALVWPFVALCNEITGFLAQDADSELNYLAGETVRVPLGMRQRVSKYVLRAPNGQRQRRTAPPGETSLTLSTTDALGNYRITAGGESERLDRGFSVNADARLSDLTRVDQQTLAAGLPTDRFEIATSLEDAEQYVQVGRSGRELFPWAIMCVTIVWGAEHLLANRFYRSE